MDFFDCLQKILECSAYTFVCVVAAGECLGVCKIICDATLGLGCVTCIMTVCVDAGPACLDAFTCWGEYYDVCLGPRAQRKPTQEN